MTNPIPELKSINRRTLLKATLNLIGGSALSTLGLTIYSGGIEPNLLSLERVRLSLPGLPAAFDGMRIVQISDLHYGNTTPVRMIEQAVKMALDLAADVIVITGDFVTDQVDEDGLRATLNPLREHPNVFAVMGNHDHWTDVNKVRGVIASARIGELRNTAIPIEKEDQRLWLAGVDDIWEKKNDLNAALADVPPGEQAILLAHEPDYADEVALDHRVMLQLSGHSHGGQVRLPFMGAIALPHLAQKYPMGLRRIDNLLLYTNRGVGQIYPAVRFNCPPEVTEITLRRLGFA